MSISFRQQVGKNIVLHFQLALPVKKQQVTYNNARKNYVNVYFGIMPKQAQKLKMTAKKEKITESEVLRGILDQFLNNGVCMKREPCKRTPCVGLKTLPRTIHIKQDAALRKLSEKTGRGISQLVRLAISQYLV